MKQNDINMEKRRNASRAAAARSQFSAESTNGLDRNDDEVQSAAPSAATSKSGDSDGKSLRDTIGKFDIVAKYDYNYSDRSGFESETRLQGMEEKASEHEDYDEEEQWSKPSAHRVLAITQAARSIGRSSSDGEEPFVGAVFVDPSDRQDERTEQEHRKVEAEVRRKLDEANTKVFYPGDPLAIATPFAATLVQDDDAIAVPRLTAFDITGQPYSGQDLAVETPSERKSRRLKRTAIVIVLIVALAVIVSISIVLAVGQGGSNGKGNLVSIANNDTATPGDTMTMNPPPADPNPGSSETNVSMPSLTPSLSPSAGPIGDDAGSKDQNDGSCYFVDIYVHFVEYASKIDGTLTWSIRDESSKEEIQKRDVKIALSDSENRKLQLVHASCFHEGFYSLQVNYTRINGIEQTVTAFFQGYARAKSLDGGTASQTVNVISTKKMISPSPVNIDFSLSSQKFQKLQSNTTAPSMTITPSTSPNMEPPSSPAESPRKTQRPTTLPTPNAVTPGTFPNLAPANFPVKSPFSDPTMLPSSTPSQNVATPSASPNVAPSTIPSASPSRDPTVIPFSTSFQNEPISLEDFTSHSDFP